MTRRPDGTLEADVLQALWALDRPASPGDVIEQMQTDLAYTSIATILGRLCDKGLAERHRQGRSFVYAAGRERGRTDRAKDPLAARRHQRPGISTRRLRQRPRPGRRRQPPRVARGHRVIHFVALPLMVALAVALLGGRTLDRLAPAVAARVNAVLLVAVIVAAVPTLWILGLGGLAHLGVRSALCDWSAHLLPDHPVVSAVIGMASLGLAVAGSVRVVAVLLGHRRLRCTEQCRVPTRRFAGRVRLHTARPCRNDCDLPWTPPALERSGVRHRARARAVPRRHRHDRFLLLALVVDAAVPFMRSATGQLRFHLERWADEDAVRATSADRTVAARTIAKVALATVPTPAVLGIATHGVAARAGALIEPPPVAGALSRALISAVVTATVAALGHPGASHGGVHPARAGLIGRRARRRAGACERPVAYPRPGRRSRGSIMRGSGVRGDQQSSRLAWWCRWWRQRARATATRRRRRPRCRRQPKRRS